jgi:BirA family biotin operon repressor/biotin-[acetyl-CoA-carboxylase] ligase
LTFSLVLKADLPIAQWPRVSLTAGLAVCEALEELLSTTPVADAPGSPVRLKWPNDVYLAGRKVCGILVEVPEVKSGLIVLGVGINVNNAPERDFRSAEGAILKPATSLREFSGKEYDLTDVLVRVLRQLAAELDRLVEDADGLSRRWREHCLLEGRAVELEVGSRQVRGVCRGVADDGALLLDTESGRQRFHSGIVVRFE